MQEKAEDDDESDGVHDEVDDEHLNSLNKQTRHESAENNEEKGNSNKGVQNSDSIDKTPSRAISVKPFYK